MPEEKGEKLDLLRKALGNSADDGLNLKASLESGPSSPKSEGFSILSSGGSFPGQETKGHHKDFKGKNAQVLKGNAKSKKR